MDRAGDRQQLLGGQPLEMALEQHGAELPGQLRLAQCCVGLADGAGLLPRIGHQLLLTLLHDARPDRRRDPEPGVEVELP